MPFSGLFFEFMFHFYSFTASLSRVMDKLVGVMHVRLMERTCNRIGSQTLFQTDWIPGPKTMFFHIVYVIR